MLSAVLLSAGTTSISGASSTKDDGGANQYRRFYDVDIRSRIRKVRHFAFRVCDLHIPAMPLALANSEIIDPTLSSISASA